MSSNDSLILVTGASGFVATHILKALFAAGYHVRATTRSQRSADGIKAVHAAHLALLDVVLVGDLDAPSPWPPSIFAGVTGVLHVASAMPWAADMDVDTQLIKPAIAGVESLLAAVSAHGSSVTRVVYTSSMAALLDISQGATQDHVYSPDDWNPMTAEAAIASRDPTTGYLVSKKLAERAAWDYVTKHKPSWALTVLVPPVVYGPQDQPGATLANLVGQNMLVRKHLLGELDAPMETPYRSFVYVGDVARAHVAALETPAAAGKRYFLSGGVYQWTTLCEIVRQEFPELRDRVPDPAKTPRVRGYASDVSDAEVDLKLEFTGLRQTLREMVSGYLRMEKQEAAAK